MSPEVLTELVAKIKADATQLEKGLTDAERKTEASSKRMQESLKKVGTVMAASGAAITAALGFMGKAAIDEEINIKRLATTINNSGTAYDNVKDSLEAVIAATQRKTGVADDEQRNILNRLILVTNDYGKALELLPTVLDLAAAGEMDATTAATYLGKAFLELEEGAEEVSVRFGQASLQFKNMEDIQNRVRGSAENLANPLSILKASMGDVAEAIGANLLPIIKPLINQLVDIAIKVQEWAAEHPELAKTLTLVALGVGIVMTILGGLILILPALISGIAAFGVVLSVALGPIGLITLAVIGLIAIGILLWKNWDTIKAKVIEIWGAITNFFAETWAKIVGFFKEHWDKILAILFPAVGIPILIVREWENIKRFLQRLNPWEWIKEGWNKLAEGIKSVLKNIFGGSIIENWTAGLSSFLGNFDLAPSGEKMMGSFQEGVENGLEKTLDSAKRSIAALQAAAKAAVGTSGEEEATLAYQRARQDERRREHGLPPIYGYQHGGIITKPTLALMGEKAPAIKEAVIPETMWGELGGKMMTIIWELDGRVLSRVVMPYAAEEIRLRSGIR